MDDPTVRREFRRSSQCDGGACVEVAIGDEVAALNSDDPSKTVRFTVAEWQAFVGGVRIGEFEAM